MEYVFEELSIEEIHAIELPPEPSQVIPDVVFEDISLHDILIAKNPPLSKKQKEGDQTQNTGL